MKLWLWGSSDVFGGEDCKTLLSGFAQTASDSSDMQNIGYPVTAFWTDSWISMDNDGYRRFLDNV